MNDRWNNAKLYESYVGRWSSLAADKFLNWMNLKDGLVWLDVGCGTGALTKVILNSQNPKKVICIDPSQYHTDFSREVISNDRAEFYVCGAEKIPIDDESVDAIVSGLVLNFIPGIELALAEFKRVAKKSAAIGAYVWDYSGKMEMMRYFWDAAGSLFEDAYEKDEAIRFKICNSSSLGDLFISAGFSNVGTTFIDVPTVFKNFEDYWNPFLSGIGPAPGYCISLSEQKRELLRQKIYSSLPIEKDGRIKLIARAIAVKGIK